MTGTRETEAEHQLGEKGKQDAKNSEEVRENKRFPICRFSIGISILFVLSLRLMVRIFVTVIPFLVALWVERSGRKRPRS
jgi:uncharacterized membrane protein